MQSSPSLPTPPRAGGDLGAHGAQLRDATLLQVRQAVLRVGPLRLLERGGEDVHHEGVHARVQQLPLVLRDGHAAARQGVGVGALGAEQDQLRQGRVGGGDVARQPAAVGERLHEGLEGGQGGEHAVHVRDVGGGRGPQDEDVVVVDLGPRRQRERRVAVADEDVLGPVHEESCDGVRRDSAGQGGAVKGRAGQGRAGQGRAGQGRAGQGRAGQGNTGQGRAGQGRAGQGNTGQGRAGQGRAGQGRATHGRAGQGRAGQGRAGQGRATHGRAGQGRAGQGRAGQGRAGQGRAGQHTAGQGRAGQGRAGQGRAGQGRAGQGRAGQGTAGQGNTRQGSARTGQGRPRQSTAGQCSAVQVSAAQCRTVQVSAAQVGAGQCSAELQRSAAQCSGVPGRAGHAPDASCLIWTGLVEVNAE